MWLQNIYIQKNIDFPGSPLSLVLHLRADQDREEVGLRADSLVVSHDCYD